jgi:hypothetical protein
MTHRMTRSRSLALLSAIACLFAMASSASAYGPQVPTLITVTPSSLTFLCGHPEAVDATVLDQDGLPIKQATVTWSFTSSPSDQDRILQATSKTNKDGVAKTMVKLACVAGDRSITATTGGISGSAVIHVDLGHPGQGQTGSVRSGGAGATVALRGTSAVVAIGVDQSAGTDTGRVGFVLLFMGLAALVVIRRLVLARR